MNNHDDARRLLLKGLVASGLGMLVGGCDSQQGSPPTAKLSQEQVQYQPEPKGEQRCEICRHFIAESNECALVEGVISPQGWCIIWAS